MALKNILSKTILKYNNFANLNLIINLVIIINKEEKAYIIILYLYKLNI